MCTTVLNPSCFLLAAVTSTLCPVASSVGEISPEGYPTARWIFMPPCYSRRCQGMPNECQTILHWGSNEFLTECKNECMNKQLSVINKWVIDSEWAVVPWTNYSSWTMCCCCCCCCSIAVVRLLESISPCPLVKPCFSPYAYVCTYMYIHVHTLYTYMCCLRPFLLLTPHIIIWYHINNIKHTSKIYSYIIITSIHTHIYIYIHAYNIWICVYRFWSNVT